MKRYDIRKVMGLLLLTALGAGQLMAGDVTVEGNVLITTNLTVNKAVYGGRSVWGLGLYDGNIASTALGASQRGYNNGSGGGSMYIGIESYGAGQQLYNYGNAGIGDYSAGSLQCGYNVGSMVAGPLACGSLQRGKNEGTMYITNGFGNHQAGWTCTGTMVIKDACGASQFGGGFATTVISNNGGTASIQLAALMTSNQLAYMSGQASLGLGACRVTNDQAIVAGDGLVSHGKGSITAGGGFYGSGSNITGITAAQVGSIATNGGMASNLSVTNIALSGTVTFSTNTMVVMLPQGDLSMGAFTNGPSQ